MIPSSQQRQDIKHVDYKDEELLRKFIDQHARILPRRRTGLTAKKQRELSRAIKRARFMGILPYVAR